MRYHILACDYDGTLAEHGKVDKDTLAALERLLATGRKLVLVTGRELPELLQIFPEVHYFSHVVAENGALLYCPATREEKALAPAPDPVFIETARKRGVNPLAVGRVIVATWRPHETELLKVIQELGLELQIIFNKDAVMILPSGVNKATGLKAALTELGFSPHEAVGVGDAENDHAFLALCECSAAVANALPVVKEHADYVATKERGAGVAELIDELIASDLAPVAAKLERHNLLIGHDEKGAEVRLPAFGPNILIAGPSGSGKSTAATSFLERLADAHYQFCIIDPEGDYSELPAVTTLGNEKKGPTVEEVAKKLSASVDDMVVNLIGLPLSDRPPFFLSLLPQLQELRARFGRPHWVIIDEAHHLLPKDWEPGRAGLPHDWQRTVLITVHPDQVAQHSLQSVEHVIAVGKEAEKTIKQFQEAIEEPLSADLKPIVLEEGRVLLWSRTKKSAQRVKLVPSKIQHHRHLRKYAEGELPPEQSFTFHGPLGKLNLQARNLIQFMQMSDGVDDDTWTYHLQIGDYEKWFREKIKDEQLADEAKQLKQKSGLLPAEGRKTLRAAIERRYTLPARPPLPLPGTAAETKKDAVK